MSTPKPPSRCLCPACGKAISGPTQCPRCNPAQATARPEDRRRAAWTVSRETLAGKE